MAALLGKKQKESRPQEGEKQRRLELDQAGSIWVEEIALRLHDIRARIKSLEREMQRLAHESPQQPHPLRLVEQWTAFQKKIGQQLERLSCEDTRRILQLLVTAVAVDSVQGEITIKRILPVDETLPLPSRGHTMPVGVVAQRWAPGVSDRQEAALRAPV